MALQPTTGMLIQGSQPTTASESNRLFPYVTDGRDLNSGQSRSATSEQDIQMLTEAELRNVFAEDKRLQDQYNNVDNYINYMNDFMDIVDANPGQFNWWDSAIPYGIDTMGFADRYGLHDEDARMGSGERIDASLEARRTATERFENLMSSPEMTALRDQYGLTSQFQNSDGDVFAFNGINFTETYEVDDSEGRFIEPIMNLANSVALSLAVGEASNVFGDFLSTQAELGNLGETLQVASQVADRFEQAGYSANQTASLLNNSNVIMNIAQTINGLEEEEFDQDDIPPEDVIGPTEDLGVEDSIFQILYDTIIGEQGIPEGVSPEVLEALRGDFGPTTTPAELREVAIEIAEAGGYEEWLAQQDLEGPPEELPTELEEEVDIDADTTLEDEIGVEPDMPINIPFPDLPPREEGEGDSEGNGNGADGQQEAAQGEGDNEEYQLPDYGDIGQDYEPPLPRGQGGTIYDVPIQDDPGFTVGLGVPVLGSIGSGGGDGGNGGEGGGGVASTGMLTPRFNPYMASIGYTPVAVPKPILPQAPIVSSLFSEFLS